MSKQFFDQNIQVPQFELTSNRSNFQDYKRCFKSCISQMKVSGLTTREQDCLHNCLGKYSDAQLYLAEKMTNEFAKLINQDPSLKMAFSKNK